jgi:hypothetical protein
MSSRRQVQKLVMRPRRQEIGKSQSFPLITFR